MSHINHSGMAQWIIIISVGDQGDFIVKRDIMPSFIYTLKHLFLFPGAILGTWTDQIMRIFAPKNDAGKVLKLCRTTLSFYGTQE